MTMSALLTSIGDIVTASITWATSFVTFITGQPLVLLFVLVGFVGLGIGILKRCISC